MHNLSLSKIFEEAGFKHDEYYMESLKISIESNLDLEKKNLTRDELSSKLAICEKVRDELNLLFKTFLF